MLYHAPTRNVSRPTAEHALRLPFRRLLDFRRVSLGRGASAEVRFRVNATALGLVDSNGDTVLYGGVHSLVASRGHGEELSATVLATPSSPRQKRLSSFSSCSAY